VQVAEQYGALLHKIERQKFQLAEHGLEQLKQMLAVGPYTHLKLPLPQCLGDGSADLADQPAAWKLDAAATGSSGEGGSANSVKQVICYFVLHNGMRSWGNILKAAPSAEQNRTALQIEQHFRVEGTCCMSSAWGA
jgi:hypothetical protein